MTPYEQLTAAFRQSKWQRYEVYTGDQHTVERWMSADRNDSMMVEIPIGTGYVQTFFLDRGLSLDVTLARIKGE
jgi:hypothetical protein